MNSNSPKFNPAALPSEYMKTFERQSDSLEPQAQTHFLYPGQIFTTCAPTTITTILGSCAAVCLWDRRLRIGGMNHYLLADGEDGGPNRFRYGNNANPALLLQLLSRGCQIKDLQAKIFGGASAFSVRPEESLGQKNVEIAEEFLRDKGIPLLVKDVSGSRGRRLSFQTHDGATSIKVFDQPKRDAHGF
jgi:chemotaxis protein CheD